MQQNKNVIFAFINRKATTYMKKVFNYFSHLNDVRIMTIVTLPMKWLFMISAIIYFISFFTFYKKVDFIFAVLCCMASFWFYALKVNHNKKLTEDYLESRNKEIGALKKMGRNKRRKFERGFFSQNPSKKD